MTLNETQLMCARACVCDCALFTVTAIALVNRGTRVRKARCFLLILLSHFVVYST